ncbi:MAG: substrate-binding domain-containing protein [Phycisphaerae bacterium]
MDKTPVVALLVDSRTRYGRTILQGIARYIRTHSPWNCFVGSEPVEGFPRGLRQWSGDGIIATLHHAEAADQLRSFRVPVVNVANRRDIPGIPTVACDDVAIGRLGAEHFLERGFRNLAFFGLPEDHYSIQRRQGFLDRCAQEQGVEATAFRHPPLVREDWAAWRRDAAAWVRTLPTPIGVMACDDNQGRTLLAVCHSLGLRVPEDVAILGVDNDDVYCELCMPPLSSIEPAGEVRGYESAALLAKLMDGESPPQEPIRVPPRSVVVRQSSDVLELDDAEVAAALRYIRRNSHRPISVSDLLEEVPISRKSLELRFARAIGRLPGEEIRRAHLERAKTLLTETDYPLEDVARGAGLRSAKTLCDIFRRYLDKTPSEYRREHYMR